jgi:hypothetical protein
MITEKSIFTLEISEWVSKVRAVPHYLYTKRRLPSKNTEGATLRR